MKKPMLRAHLAASCAALSLLLGSAAVQAQGGAGNAVLVTVDNFVRAETDSVFANGVKSRGLGKFEHYRQPLGPGFPVVRPNRDTLYSLSVFDLGAGPLTITLPDAGRRFMSMQVIDEDHYTPEVFYGAGTYTFTQEKIGTRYISLGVRMLVDPASAADVAQVHALQDAIVVSQPGGPGRFEVPDWDPVSKKKVRDALLALAETMPDTQRTFGPRSEVDPVRHLVGTAFAFGGNPQKDALYLNVTPARNDGTTVYHLKVKDVPVDAFWSISVYDAQGHFQKNALDAYTLNNTLATKSADGAVAIQFGGCDGKVANCLPVMKGWKLHGAPVPPARRDPRRALDLPAGAAMKRVLAAMLVAASLSVSAQQLLLDDDTIRDAYVYLLGRALVIRQEKTDLREPGVAYNTIKYNPLGSADFVNPNFDVAYLEAWFAVDDSTPVMLEVPEIKGRYYTAQIIDEWGEVIANINERTFPSRPFGRFLLVKPGSKVPTPPGAGRIELHSGKAKMLARVELKGDPEGAARLQKAFKLSVAGTPAIDQPVDIPMFDNKELIGVEIFERADEILASALDVAPIAARMQQMVRAVAAQGDAGDQGWLAAIDADKLAA
ncbi:DUF1254 domain-containing protein [Variovorax humicola]|uniref:DUF1254 domain-containing protein n=1 Tax=Variovorax humicola TaxID=1769758 RepID=A0ABU8VXY4_9BURK